MDRVQKLEYEKTMEDYFHEHKVYDLIERLFEELIINKPENPIDYLIERLKRKTPKRIFITGYSGTSVKTISLALANNLGYTCLNISHLLEREISKNNENSEVIKKNLAECRLVDDETVIDLLRNQIIKYEEENISYIIEGFPRNRTQAIFLQSLGLLPDHIIVLTTDKQKSEEALFDIIKENLENNGEQRTEEQIKSLAKISVNETELNLKSLEEIFRGFYCEINVDNFEQESEVVEKLANLLKFKQKTSDARKPPHIMLIAPPCLNKKKIGSLISNQLKIIHIDIMDLLTKEISAKNENSINILSSLEQNDLVHNKHILKLLEDRLYCSDCMINGWIVTGFPKSELQINYMEKMNSEIRPSLIAVIDADEKKIEENAEKKKYDPKTGKSYIEGSQEYSELKDEDIKRLTKRQQEEGDILKKRIENWKQILDIILKKDYKNLIKLNGNDSESKIAETIIDAVGFNS
jgi:adenylate kinase